MRYFLKIFFLPILLIFAVISGVIKAIFGAGNLKYIPKIIQQNATSEELSGCVFKEIKFPQVVAYAEENGTLLRKESDCVEFIISISSVVYHVNVSRAFDGSNCAVINSSIYNNVLERNKSDVVKIKPKSEPREDSYMSEKVEELSVSYDSHLFKCKW